VTVYRFRIDMDATGDASAVEDIPAQDGAYYVDDESDAGAFQFTIDSTAPAATGLAFDEGRVVRFKINTTDDRCGVIERPKFTPINRLRNQRLTVVTGRDIICEFDYPKTAPPMGWLSRPTVTQVQFNYLHPFMDRSDWIEPTFIGPVFHADLDPSGMPFTPPVDGKPGKQPKGWPDVFTGWIWAGPVDGNGSHPIGQRAYFYLPLALEPTPFMPIYTMDDVGKLGMDGALIDAGTNPPGVQWVQCTAAGVDEPSAAVHHITARGVSTATVYHNPSNLMNPGAFAFVAYQQLVSPFLEYDNVVARTAVGTDETGNPLVGGDWLCTSRDAGDPEPGFTPGRAFRLLFEQAVADGFLNGWTLDFDDDIDSNGDTWAEFSTLSARVGVDSLLDVIRAWHQAGVWDCWADSSARILHATAFGHRGNFHLAGSAVNWHGEHVIKADVEGKA
jgi:hypothetical protein